MDWPRLPGTADALRVLHVVDLALGDVLANDVGHGHRQVLHVAEARQVLAVAGDAHGAARVDALEEGFCAPIAETRERIASDLALE